MASRAYSPPIEPVVQLPPVLAFAIGARFAPRSTVENLIERMVDALDEIDGDPDEEANGDEMDGTASADDPLFPSDQPLLATTDGLPGDPDDAEPGGDEADGTNAEDEPLTGWTLRYARNFGPGCIVADSDRAWNEV